MGRHTSFGIGGPADIYAVPTDKTDVIRIVEVAHAEAIPLFILGAGANILVSDKGIRGIVMDMSVFSEIAISGTRVQCGTGAEISRVSEYAAIHSLSGLEFIYKMPGSVGGALWMNARCYGRSIADVPGIIHFLDDSLEEQETKLPNQQFTYKKSPFQGSNAILLYAEFFLQEATEKEIRPKMREIEADRRSKGHFEYPSAGSVFKNNRDFGKPSGKILDELGLRGMQQGGAQIAPFHANIIVNTGKATAEDVRQLILYAQRLAYEQKNITLEPEIRLIGEW